MTEFPIAYKDQEVLRQETPTGVLAINEVFYSIQGEGHYVGVPMVFVRTNLCRIGCKFCDTKYTWQFISHNKFYTPQQLLDKVREIAPKCKHVCITGGEPFEQEKALLDTCRFFRDNGMLVHIETSGSIIISKEFADYCHWIVCSPKSFNGANFDSPIKELKVLITKNSDMRKIRALISKFKKKINVSIQPIEPFPIEYGNIDGLTEEQKEERLKMLVEHDEKFKADWKANRQKAIEICQQTGYRLSLQIHKYLRVR